MKVDNDSVDKDSVANASVGNDIDVLMIGWEFPPNISGGLGTACFGLTRGAAALGGIRTTFALPRLQGNEDGRHVALISAGVPAGAAGLPRPSSYSGTILQEVLRYGAHAQQILAGAGSFDVIHAHDWLTAPVALRIRELTGKPLVLHVHSTEYDRSGGAVNAEILAIETEALRRADIVVAVSERTRASLVERYGVAPARIAVVYNGIELGPAPQRSAPGSAPTIAFLGRVTQQKGPASFLHAAAAALRQIPGLRFILAGDGDQLAAMRTLAAQLDIARQVTFTGFLDSEGIEHLFACSDAFVMPSAAEPFGIVALEAVNAGVPVILARTAGVAELLTHAIQIDHDDIAAIAQAMIDIVTDPVLARGLRDGARREVAEISWQRSAISLAAVYRQLCPQGVTAAHAVRVG